MKNNYEEKLYHLIEEALLEDIGDRDHTTFSCIPEQQTGKAILKIKEEGILAGIEVAKHIFLYKDNSCIFQQYKNDGDKIYPGEIAFEINAPIHKILSRERLALNCMQRMSGIASLTRKYADTIKGYHTQILDTRKTTPNFRLLEKEAVRIGGGINHRFGLYDMILLKDNHIDYCGGIAQAIEKAWTYLQQQNLSIQIEIETRNLDEVQQVCATGNGKVARIMLDNFTPELIRKALIIINKEFKTEASGGINLDNLVSYAETGVDFVSIGGLIHQARSIDLSLKAEI